MRTPIHSAAVTAIPVKASIVQKCESWIGSTAQAYSAAASSPIQRSYSRRPIRNTSRMVSRSEIAENARPTRCAPLYPAQERSPVAWATIPDAALTMNSGSVP